MNTKTELERKQYQVITLEYKLAVAKTQLAELERGQVNESNSNT